ncbi:sirohydrochlorin chelatase [Peribacillus sp. NPDC046944]|uniref:sirohydrochlorin chelatase n=1 Tax=unclassified Peribacillus TaxID=2675266 RepID=UPI003CFC0216
MEAILYICHGSRVKEASAQAIDFIRICMKRHPNVIQEYCFLELESPTIEEAYAACVYRGATKIKAIPILLLTAAHGKHDIPQVLRKMKNQFPDVEMKYGRPIGVSERMVDILEERLVETKEKITENSLVLLVGRGSSDPDVKRDLGHIANSLQNRIPNTRVKDCYLTAASPSFGEALLKANSTPVNQIFVIPYLLFTGLLMQSMERAISEVQRNSDKKFVLCPYLGYHPKIEQAISDRIQELSGESAYVSDYA